MSNNRKSIAIYLNSAYSKAKGLLEKVSTKLSKQEVEDLKEVVDILGYVKKGSILDLLKGFEIVTEEPNVTIPPQSSERIDVDVETLEDDLP